MKETRNIILFAVAFALVAFCVFRQITYRNLKQRYDVAMQNNKAYESQLDAAIEDNKAFMMDIDQLRYMNDSSIRQLDSLRKEIGIRDRKIRQMGKIREYVYVTDTVVVNDTIFSNEGFRLDTTLGDQWYHNRLVMEYPNRISSTIDINTDQNVFLHETRETVDPPRKTWIGRLFQRKHNVYNVTVIENNPYASIRENKFIIIEK